MNAGCVKLEYSMKQNRLPSETCSEQKMTSTIFYDVTFIKISLLTGSVDIEQHVIWKFKMLQIRGKRNQ